MHAATDRASRRALAGPRGALVRLACLAVLVSCAPKPSPLAAARSSSTVADSARAIEAHRLKLAGQQRACEAEQRRVFTEEDLAALGARVLSRWLARVGQPLATRTDPRLTTLRQRFAKPGWTFLVVESTELDTFSTPPSTVLVTAGAMKALGDDALAGVVAHEVAHLEHEDALNLVRRKNALACSTAVATRAVLEDTSNFGLLDGGVGAPSTASLTAMADALLEELMDTGYGPKRQGGHEEERRADQRAVALLKSARLPVRPWARALERFESLSVPHPSTAERVKALDAAGP